MSQRGQLTEQVYQTAKQRLLNGEYNIGDRISVEELVVELGTSRQPVLDALRRLATEQFIEIIPQVGVRVVVPERQEMLDFFQLLAATESVCAALAAERADRAGAAALTAINEQINLLMTEDLDDAARARRYRTLNREFHRQLITLAKSDTLTSIAAFMWDRSDFFVSSAFDVKLLMERLRAAYEEHNSVCRAVAANDPERARQAMEDHVLAFAQNIEHG